MPRKLKTPYKLTPRGYVRFKNRFGEVRCHDPRCPDPEIKVGDIIVTRTNHNPLGVSTLIYHKACALALNIIVEAEE